MFAVASYNNLLILRFAQKSSKIILNLGQAISFIRRFRTAPAFRGLRFWALTLFKKHCSLLQRFQIDFTHTGE